jgi:hypothetical protein
MLISFYFREREILERERESLVLLSLTKVFFVIWVGFHVGLDCLLKQKIVLYFNNNQQDNHYVFYFFIYFFV